MIDTFFNILKKGMVLTVFLIFGFAATYIPQMHTSNVETAEAGGAFDPIDFPFDVNNAVQTTINTISTSWQYLKENVLDGLAWTIAKQLISNIIGSVVDWINSGFQGSPAFIQDLPNFLLETADDVTGYYINELGLADSWVCSPFRLDVQLAVALEYDLTREREEYACTLGTAIDNFEGFLDGTKENSSWADWFNLVAEPNSTPYGAIVTAKSNSRFRILDAQNNEIIKSDWGNGFLSGELCSTAAGADGSQQDCFITKPGRMLQEALTFNTVEAGTQVLVEADEFNEIIVALLGQLTQRAVTGAAGLLGLSGGTGSSYTGYSRGSFTADLADGVVNDTGAGGTTNVTSNPEDYVAGGVQSSRDFINQGLQAQSTILNTVDTYVQDLTNFINNPLNDSDDILFAQQALNEATGIRSRVSAGVTSATPILTTYDALEQEYPTATAARRTEIRTQQATLLQQYSTLNLVTTQEYDIYTPRWDQLLANNVGGFIGTPGTPLTPGTLLP